MTRAVPATVRVGPHVVTVDITPETGRLLRDEDARADSRPDHLLIRLDVDRPHTAVAETPLHELLHHIWAQTSLRVDHADDEESIVSAVSARLLDVLRSNPDLVAYLTGEG